MMNMIKNVILSYFILFILHDPLYPVLLIFAHFVLFCFAGSESQATGC